MFEQVNTPINTYQSTLRPPEVHMFYRKIELCITRMGDNNMHATCTHEQEIVDHVIPELQDYNIYIDHSCTKC